MPDDVTERLDRIERTLRRLVFTAKKVRRLVSLQAARYIGIEDAAAYTGLCSRSIRRLLDRGELTALRPVAGKVLIDRREIDNLVLSAKHRAAGGRGLASRN
jgi:excisionase family DNA binding protein